MKCCMWNVTSMINKTPSIMEHIIDRKPDIVFLSETWLQSDSNEVTALVKSYGYKLMHNTRKNRAKVGGGGVGLLMKFGLKYKQLKCKFFNSFEITMVKLFLKNNILLLVSIYRILFVPVNKFLEEIVKLLEIITSNYQLIVLTGDINIHMDENTLYPGRFKDILETFNIKQHVQGPTHIQGHTLDIVATYDDAPVISDINVSKYDVSHHFLIDFTIAVIPHVAKHKVVTYRKLKNISADIFTNVITQLEVSASRTFEENIRHYNDTLSSVLNDQAPIKSRTIKIVPNAPWFDHEYAELRKQRRKAEKTYHRSGLEVHKEIYVDIRKQTTDLAFKKKCKYLGERLEMGNTRVMHSTIRQLLDKNQEVVLPDSACNVELANSFLDFFSSKIEKIRSSFQTQTGSLESVDDTHVNGKLTTFESVSEDDLRKLIMSYGIKTSPEDPIPTELAKQYVDLLLPIWTKLVNVSIAEGSMDCLKNAIILPLIKDLDSLVDRDNLKNYRPVSNLMYVGKLIERVVSIQLHKHMTNNNLDMDFQHGYKKGHSCETLLLKVTNDILVANDNKMPSILMLLDLSAAFDTVDQEKLLVILKNEIGIEGIALNWFKSFLQNRTQKVKIGVAYSKVSALLYGVPQGSVLGPDLFGIYIRSIKKHVAPSKFSIFGFADDHQLHKVFLPVFQVDALGNEIQHCFNLISNWMNKFFLKLNSDKTKILVISPPSIRDNIFIGGTYIDKKCVRFVRKAKNLGVILDDELQFKPQILKVVQSCFRIIRDLAKIKYFLSYEQLRTAISIYVFSRLDYCNSLYYGLNTNLINKLQSVQNSAARLLRRKKGFGDISTAEVIRKCHWLRIRERVLFKICLITHKSLQTSAPKSVRDMLVLCQSTRTMQLMQYEHSGKHGDRCFSRISPKLWNLLPKVLRMETEKEKFKRGLKTLLFDSSANIVAKLHVK